ncbi:MAG: hypothetical protein GY715_00730 [Planctomycetes bacterium]|nr:hypothetical protein [Planctomycetota bacterium]
MSFRSRHVVIVYALTFVWLVAWFWLGAADLGASQHFSEGGPVDALSTAFLVCSGLLAWIAAIAGRGRGEGGTWFWVVSVVGFAWLVVDERFQVHEQVGFALGKVWSEPPLLRNWNDAIFVVYGLGAGVLLLAAGRTLLRYRRCLLFLGVGAACFVLHTAIDLVLPSSTAHKTLVEESFKVLSAASFAVAYLHAVRQRLDPVPAPSRVGPGAATVAAVAGLTLLLAVALMLAGRSPDSYDLLSRGWGDPLSWLLFVCFGATAILVALSRVVGRFATRSAVVFWAGSTVVWSLLALTELPSACFDSFQWLFDDELYPVPIYLRVPSLADPASLELVLIAAALIIVTVPGVRAMSSVRWLRWAPAIAALLLPVLLAARTIWPEADTANALLRAALAAAALASAMVWYRGAPFRRAGAEF